MELDFSRLNDISRQQAHTGQLGEGLKEETAKPEKAQKEPQKAIDGHSNEDLSIPKLDMVQEDHMKAQEVYKRFQENAKISYQIRTEILKGVESGADIEDLFLKACKVISVMSDDTGFYSQVEQRMKAIKQTE